MKKAKVEPEQEITGEEVKNVPGKYGTTFCNIIEVLRIGHGYFRKRQNKTKSSVYKINVGSKRYAVCDIKGLHYLFDNEKVEKEPGFGRLKLDTDLTDSYIPSIFSNGVRHEYKKAFAIELCQVMRQVDTLIPSILKVIPEYFQKWNGNVTKEIQRDWEFEILSLVNDVVSEAFLGTRLDAHCSLYYVRGLFKKKYKKPGMEAYQNLSKTLLGCPKLNEIFKIAREAGLTEREAMADLLFMLTFNAIGGIDTSLISALGRFSLLEKKHQQDIINEVKETIKAKGMTEESLKEMKYLNNFLLEVYRLHPSVELVFGKAKLDFVMSTSTGNYQIYQGDLLMGHFQLAQMDPKIFEEPTKFKPQRFEENPDLINNLILFHGLFNDEAGPKNHKCPGQAIAVTIMMGTLAYFFANTEFELTKPPCWTGKDIRRFGCPDKPIGLKTFTYKIQEDVEVQDMYS